MIDENIAAAIHDMLLGLALSIPLEIAGALIQSSPQAIDYWSIFGVSTIVLCKLLILILAIIIIEIMGHWGLMYTIGYFLGSVLMSTMLGFDLLNLIIIIIIIFATFLITIIRIR